MAATGELIRLVNYVDDINTTLRRISASIPGMEAEERTRLADHLREASTGLTGASGAAGEGRPRVAAYPDGCGDRRRDHGSRHRARGGAWRVSHHSRRPAAKRPAQS